MFLPCTNLQSFLFFKFKKNKKICGEISQLGEFFYEIKIRENGDFKGFFWPIFLIKNN
jgi:hypothetical protein